MLMLMLIEKMIMLAMVVIPLVLTITHLLKYYVDTHGQRDSADDNDHEEEDSDASHASLDEQHNESNNSGESAHTKSAVSFTISFGNKKKKTQSIVDFMDVVVLD